MKNLATCVLTMMVLGVVLVPGSADAGVGAYATWWNAGDLDNGFGVGAKLSILNIIPLVTPEIRAGWVAFNEADVNAYPLELAATVDFAMAYAGAGVGYYIFDGEEVKVDDEFGGFLLGGVKFTLMGLGVFAEGKYHIMDQADGFGINVGAVLGF